MKLKQATSACAILSSIPSSAHAMDVRMGNGFRASFFECIVDIAHRYTSDGQSTMEIVQVSSRQERELTGPCLLMIRQNTDNRILSLGYNIPSGTRVPQWAYLDPTQVWYPRPMNSLYLVSSYLHRLMILGISHLHLASEVCALSPNSTITSHLQLQR